MATATAQDEDLLIIADDNEASNDSGDIEFSFDFGGDAHKKEEAKTEEVITSETKIETLPESDLGISFDMWEEKIEETKIEESKIETGEVKAEEDFSFDLGIADASTDGIQKSEEKIEEKIEITDTVKSTQAEEITETSTTSDETSMNAILSGTIAKLQARQDVIANDKSGKTSKEEEIKAQIKELQAQVKDLEAEMKALDSESNKITANIAELENMKLDPVKEHNAKRVAKK